GAGEGAGAGGAEWRDGSGFRVLDGGRAPRSAPAWGPGGRHVVWSSEAPGISSLMGVAFDPEVGREEGVVRQVTDLPRAASLPAVDPAGDWLVFSVLGADGWTLVRLPWAPDRWFEPLPEDPRFRSPPQDPGTAAPPARGPDWTDSGSWSGRSTLVPRYVLPLAAAGEGRGGTRVMAHRVGLSTGAGDALGRTRWEARYLEPVGAGVSGREAGLGITREGPLGGSLFLSADQSWTVPGLVRRDEDGSGTGGEDIFVRARERRVTTGLRGTDPRDGHTRVGRVEVAGVSDVLALVDGEGGPVEGLRLARPRRSFLEGTAQLSIQAVRGGALSLGPRRGGVATLRARARADVGEWGREGDASRRDLAGRLAGWIPLGRRGSPYLRALPEPGQVHWRPDPVLAARLVAAVGGGPGSGPGHLPVGGSQGELLGVRGVPAGLLAGRTAWAGSLEVRMPIALVHRGMGVLPVHGDRLFGVAFLEAGGVRAGSGSPAGVREDDGSSPGPGGAAPRTVATAGVELVGTGSLGFAPLPPLRAGVTLRVAGPERGALGVHVGLGWSF
ncbi:MAG: hypothetical protein EA352_00825, partial [Gemmatimonadales bacterium]